MEPKKKTPYDGIDRRQTPRRASDDDIEKLERIVRDMPQLTVEEQKLLKDVLEAYRGWQVLGKAAKMLVFLLAGLSALVVGFGHLKEVLKSWLI